MKAFYQFVIEKKVIRQSPDLGEAKSLIAQAKSRLHDLHGLPLNDDNSSFRFEDAYEALREGFQSFLSLEGYKSYSHEALFSFAFEKKLLPEAEIMRADRYREIRNDINYRGKSVTVEEAKEIILFANRIVPVLEKRFLEQKV